MCGANQFILMGKEGCQLKQYYCWNSCFTIYLEYYPAGS